MIVKQVRAGIPAIHPYVPGITDDEIKKMYGLRHVVKLNANENALGPSPLAMKAIEEEVTQLHLYPDGTSERLKVAVANFHQVTPEQVMIGNGSDDLIKLLSETFLDDGDEIVTPHPSFSQYGFGAAIMRSTIQSVPLKEDFSYDVEAMLKAVTERTKLLYICSPNNPTGTILRQAEFDWLLDRLPEHVVVVLDLAYNDFTELPQRVVESDKLLQNPRVCILHTFSKLYGLAGLRIGYGLGHKTLWSYVNRVREPFNVNRIAQRAGVAALLDESHRVASRKQTQQSKKSYETLLEHGIEALPSEGNFVLVKTGDAKQTIAQLLEKGIMVRGGFRDLDAYVRITYGLEEDNAACIAALLNIRK